jgi:hypothetical protein
MTIRERERERGKETKGEREERARAPHHARTLPPRDLPIKKAAE